jgi:hypothetical protein
MIVYINNNPVSVFRGATVGEVVLAYSKRSYRLLKNGYLAVFDRFGNFTEPDGSVTEGQHFSLKLNIKTKHNEN